MTTGWPIDVIPDLIRQVRRAVRSNKISAFYIGRTAHPSQRKSWHGADDLRPIYKTTSVYNLEEVEQALIEAFYDHPKCRNEAHHSGGGVSDAKRHFVYIAVWR